MKIATKEVSLPKSIFFTMEPNIGICLVVSSPFLKTKNSGGGIFFIKIPSGCPKPAGLSKTQYT